MWRRRFPGWFRAVVLVGISGVLAGCGQAPLPVIAVPGGLSITPPAHRANGYPVTLHAIRIDAQNDNPFVPVGERIDTLDYWSQGHRVQGYLLRPPGRGPFPLEVVLHGGFFLLPDRHVPHFAVYTVPQALRLAVSDMTIFIPSYRGYGPSAGTAQSGYSDYRDARNGLTALRHIHGLKTNGQVYLLGSSLGGFVALKLAYGLPQVRAVELVSPYGGTRLFMTWLKLHLTQLDNTDLTDYFGLQSALGRNIQSSAYGPTSLSYHRLKVPILMIAGRNDPIFPLSLERTMYARLHTHDSKPVTLQVLPGGHIPNSPTAIQFLYRFFQTQIANQ